MVLVDVEERRMCRVVSEVQAPRWPRRRGGISSWAETRFDKLFGPGTSDQRPATSDQQPATGDQLRATGDGGADATPQGRLRGRDEAKRGGRRRAEAEEEEWEVCEV